MNYLRVVVRQELSGFFSFLRNIAAFNFDLWGNKDEVNLVARVGRDTSEVVEGVIYSFALCSFLIRIFQYKLIGCYSFISFRLVCYVEISSQYSC